MAIVGDSFGPRRLMLGAAKKFFLEPSKPPTAPPARIDPPRLTPALLEKHRMSRTRTAVLDNLDEMYREAFNRAKESGDDSQLATLDFAYRREQLYFEILLDIRDAMERG